MQLVVTILSTPAFFNLGKAFSTNKPIQSAEITCKNINNAKELPKLSAVAPNPEDKTTWRAEFTLDSAIANNGDKFNCKFKLSDLAGHIAEPQKDNLIIIDSAPPTITDFKVTKSTEIISSNGILGQYADTDNYNKNSYEVSFKVDDTGQNTKSGIKPSRD